MIVSLSSLFFFNPYKTRFVLIDNDLGVNQVLMDTIVDDRQFNDINDVGIFLAYTFIYRIISLGRHI